MTPEQTMNALGVGSRDLLIWDRSITMYRRHDGRYESAVMLRCPQPITSRTPEAALDMLANAREEARI